MVIGSQCQGSFGFCLVSPCESSHQMKQLLRISLHWREHVSCHTPCSGDHCLESNGNEVWLRPISDTTADLVLEALAPVDCIRFITFQCSIQE